MKSAFFFSQTGCLLPLLILGNLFFGWIFLGALHWLLLEVILVSFFIINSYILTRKIISGSRKADNVIDVKGEVIEEKK